MSEAEATRAKRYPLHLTIAVAFTALLLVIGLTLISFNYLETRKIALLGRFKTLVVILCESAATDHDLDGKN